MGHSWIEHVESTIKLHPGKKLREVLKLAKRTYRKSPIASKRHKTRRKHKRSTRYYKKQKKRPKRRRRRRRRRKSSRRKRH